LIKNKCDAKHNFENKIKLIVCKVGTIIGGLDFWENGTTLPFN